MSSLRDAVASGADCAGSSSSYGANPAAALADALLRPGAAGRDLAAVPPAVAEAAERALAHARAVFPGVSGAGSAAVGGRERQGPRPTAFPSLPQAPTNPFCASTRSPWPPGRPRCRPCPAPLRFSRLRSTLARGPPSTRPATRRRRSPPRGPPNLRARRRERGRPSFPRPARRGRPSFKQEAPARPGRLSTRPAAATRPLPSAKRRADRAGTTRWTTRRRRRGSPRSTPRSAAPLPTGTRPP